MKKLTLFVFLLSFNSIYLFSQSVSLNELIIMSKMDIDAFDSYVTGKGYSFKENKDLSTCSLQAYSFDDLQGRDGLGVRWLTLEYNYTDEKNKGYVQYQTIYKKDYVDLKNSLLKNGFKFQQTKKLEDEEGIKFIYKKGKIEIRLTSKLSTDTNRTLYILELLNYN
jgi:hypothetical protein